MFKSSNPSLFKQSLEKDFKKEIYLAK